MNTTTRKLIDADEFCKALTESNGVLSKAASAIGVLPGSIQEKRTRDKEFDLRVRRTLTAIEAAASKEPSFENLMLFTIDRFGSLSLRRGGSGTAARLGNEIAAEASAFLRRPFDHLDCNPDICELLVSRWKRAGLRASSIQVRYEFFMKRNAVAAALGWDDEHDFSHIHPYRQLSWKETRQLADWPDMEPLPDNILTGNAQIDDKRSMTLSTLLEDHYIPAKLVGKSENTIRLYRICIRNFARWLGRDPIVADLNLETVGKYLRHAVEKTNLSPHTIEKERAEFTSFWNFAAKRGWLDTFPDIPSISCPDRVPTAWTDEEMVQLMNACENAPGKIGELQANAFWPALISVIYDSGERISAVLSIVAADVDSDGWLTVRGEHRKGKTRDKRYKLRPITVERIQSLGVTSGPLFALPFAENYLFRKFGDVLQAAGLPSTRKDKFHKIRRTTASNFEAAGGNATQLLDHTDRRTTQAYLDPKLLKEVQPADIVPGIGETAVTVESSNDAILDEFKAFLTEREAR